MNGDEEVIQEDEKPGRATTVSPTVAKSGPAASKNGSEEIEEGGYPSEEPPPSPSPEEDTDD